jgi:hypothetical protein
LAALTFAANSRPTTFPIGFIVALGLVVVMWRARELDRRSIVLLAGIAIIPASCGLLVFQMKFGQFLPDWSNYQFLHTPKFQQYLVINNGMMNGLRFLPTNLLAILRPDSLLFVQFSPSVVPRFFSGDELTYLWPLAPGSVYAEPFVSISAAMPVPFLLAPLSFIGLLGRRVLATARSAIEPVLMVAFCVPILIDSMTYGLASRYLSDDYPLMVMAVAFAPALIARLSARRRLLVALAVVIFIVALGGIWVNHQLLDSL